MLRPSSFSLNCFWLPTNSPLSSAHAFQEANSAEAGSHQVDLRSHRSSIHAAIASSASKYAAVASATAIGFARPSACHFRQPSTAHCRIPGHSVLSFSVRSLSRSSGGMVMLNGMRWNRRRIASSTLQSRFMVPRDDKFESRDEFEEILPHEACANMIAAGQALDFGFCPTATFLGLDGAH
jgi:hypothetical protein